ncbi:hypothetical protein Lal_00018804 [Lupinus albus]|nr:hypothetical protein Lal_00018804 [Lupinus albus]
MTQNDQKGQHQRGTPGRGGMLEMGSVEAMNKLLINQYIDVKMLRSKSCGKLNPEGRRSNSRTIFQGKDIKTITHGVGPWWQDQGASSAMVQQPRPPYQRNNQYQHPTEDRIAMLEDTLNHFLQMTMNMEIQIGQLIKQLAGNQKGTFSTNTKASPREHCNAIMKEKYIDG